MWQRRAQRVPMGPEPAMKTYKRKEREFSEASHGVER
jgi:hypothetical protein